MSPSEAAGPGIMTRHDHDPDDDSSVMAAAAAGPAAAVCLTRIGSQCDNPSRIADVSATAWRRGLSKLECKSELLVVKFQPECGPDPDSED
jgi:hypothetical protein